MKRIQAETEVSNLELLAHSDLEQHTVTRMFLTMGNEIRETNLIEVEKIMEGPKTQYHVEFYVCTREELQKIINLVRQIQRRPLPRMIDKNVNEIYDLITK